MAELRLPLLRTLARFGTGCGLVVDGDDLVVTLSRVWPQGARLVAAQRIEGFRQRPAAEWGAEYTRLLQSHRASDARALLVLPRHEVIVRTLKLAGVRDEDAAAAIRFQLDTLHPYGDDEVGYDFQRAGRGDSFVVAIAERRTIEFYTALFAEAGVVLSGITFSGGAVFSSLRLFGAPPADGFVAAVGLKAETGPEWELYGESPSHALFSARLDVPLERAAKLAAAELRLTEAEPGDLIDLLPAWQSAPDESDFSDAGRSRAALPWAAALAAACPRLGTPLNLLPLELRSTNSRWLYAPTYVLAAVLLLIAGALAGRGAWMNRAYTTRLEAEMKRLEPAAKQVETLDRKLATVSERIQRLDDYRKTTKANLDIILEVTQSVTSPGFVMLLQIDPKTMVLSGEVEQADGLLKKFDSSPRFSGSEFTTPLARTGNGEVFRLRTNRRGGAK